MIDEREIAKRVALMAALKKRLVELDDVESAVHKFEHHLLAGSMETATEFCALVQRLGFSSTQPMRVVLDAAPNDPWFAFDVISERDTKMPSILHESLMMVMLADMHAVIYNGSGVLAIPSSSATA
jgi:regulator of RNase E activity RraB